MVWKSVFTSGLFQPGFLAPFQPLQEEKEGLDRSQQEGKVHLLMENFVDIHFYRYR